MCFESIKPDRWKTCADPKILKDLNPVSHQADELFRLLEDRGLFSFNGEPG